MPRALVDLFAGLDAHVDPLVARASYYEVGGLGGAWHVAQQSCSQQATCQQAGTLRAALFDAPCLALPLLQVYNEQIYDLLDEHGVGPLGQRAALRLKEDTLGRVFVAGLSEVRAWL